MAYILQPAVGDTEAGIHILLIGVDKYPHLHDEDGTPSELGIGFNVLNAPSHSCKSLTDWFANGRLRHTDLKVKSIDVLVSRGSVQAQGARVKVEAPTFQNVQRAIERWYKLGHQSEDNLLVFYFCGHGVQHSARNHSLLCADFGADSLAPFDHAIHYEGFERGMRSCAARRQIFLLDTCRTAATELTSQFDGFGRDIVARRVLGEATRVSQSVLWATAGGAQAWAPNGAPSVFAETFLQSLRGGGAEQDYGSGKTIATIVSIQRAMAKYLAAVSDINQEPQTEQPVGNSFTLHVFDDELSIPVVVRCSPDEHTQSASLSCLKDGSLVERRKPYPLTRPDRWVFELPQGDYTFCAVSSIDRQHRGEIGQRSTPPLTFVRIPMVRK